MKKIKRSGHFELVLEILDDKYINPPKIRQRHAVLNRAIKEFTADLEALDRCTKNFVPGGEIDFLDNNREHKLLMQDEIMEDWQIPVMKEMVEEIASPGADILEIGYGRGISADMIQENMVGSHTIIECNGQIVNTLKKWRERHPDRDIRIVNGLWQDTIDRLGLFDGIFFHTYPLNEDEYMRYVQGGVTFAEHFFSTASNHLNKGGAFTYFSNEIDSLSREHQRQLLNFFSSFSVRVIPLNLPENLKDTWWANSIVIVRAVK